MEMESATTKIEKLNQSNYFAWKQKISLLLALKDLDDHLTSERPADESEAIAWDKSDKKAQAIIGLSLSDPILENVRHVDNAASMWKTIQNIFERHTLLNKLSARRKFYTATKSEDETILQFGNRITHLSSTLKSMNVLIEDSEMAMALLCGLPESYDPLISALDAIGTEEDELEFEHVKSRVLQEEQRIAMRNAEASSKSETGALLSNCRSNCVNCHVAKTDRPSCEHCGKLGHTVDRCWKKYPHMNPHKKKENDQRHAFIANQDIEDPNVICLLGQHNNPGGKHKSSDWFIDSGCSNHMTYDKSLFCELSEPPKSIVELGNGNKATITARGTIRINILLDGKSVPCILKNVFLVPELGYQLLSVSTFSKNGLSTTFKNGRCFVERGGKVMVTGTLQGSLYKLDVPHCTEEASHAFISATMRVWHERFAHVNPTTIADMVDNNVVTGVRIQKSASGNMDCDGCVLGKAHRAIIPKKSFTRSTQILQLVHSDVNGPLETPSLGGSRYFITFVDDYSRWTVVYMLRKKSDSLKMFKQYHKYAQVHTGLAVGKVNFIARTSKSFEKVKSLRTDNGGEYISNAFKDYLLQNGISHQLTVAYTPQQNGVAERMNRTLIDLVRSMLHTAGIAKSFWAEALETAVYIRNRVSSRSLPKDKTPHHLWKKAIPDLAHLRIFGSKCYYTIPKKKIKKLDPRAHLGIFVGYSTQSKGYKIWDPNSRKMIVSRDVTFREMISAESAPEYTIDNNLESIDREDGTKVRFDDPNLTEQYQAEEDTILEDQNSTLQTNTGTADDTSEEGTGSEEGNSTPQALRRSFRTFTKTKPFWKSYSSFSATALSAEAVPLSYKGATVGDQFDFWKPGIEREHDALLRNNTWTLVHRSPEMHVLPCKYVFKVKNGEPKVRMVVLGCKQVYGLDYYQTFAPVVKFTTIRALLAVAAINDWECEQMDVVTAFLNGDLEEDIYMNVPEGMKTTANVNQVCKLKKALYGLKQAPRQWYSKIHDYLVINLKFTSSKNDPCLYIRKTTSDIIIIALYVDDLLILGNSKAYILKIKEELKRRFEMKDMGAAKLMLGIEITRDRSNRKIHISQKEYSQQILERFGMEESNPAYTPMERSKNRTLDESLGKPALDVPYRQAIGSLIYLVTGTRPDIAYAVSYLSRYLENPLLSHWNAVKRVLRYISGTREHGILYGDSKSVNVKGYSDSDYAGCTEERKSTGGYIFLLGKGAICWKSKKQSVTATSTCEAEYMACCLATKEAIWLSRLLADILQKESPDPISIGIDNNGSIDIAKNTSINEKSKHIDVQYHFVRECVQHGKVSLIRCPTSDQLADPLTKPLDRVKLERFRDMQGISECPF